MIHGVMTYRLTNPLDSSANSVTYRFSEQVHHEIDPPAPPARERLCGECS